MQLVKCQVQGVNKSVFLNFFANNTLAFCQIANVFVKQNVNQCQQCKFFHTVFSLYYASRFRNHFRNYMEYLYF